MAMTEWKRVRKLEKTWTPSERSVFNKLLESLELDDVMIGKLAEPMEDSIEKDVRRSYASGCLVALAAAVIIIGVAVYRMMGIPLSNETQMAKLWLSVAVQCLPILAYVVILYKRCSAEALTADKRLLLYARFVSEGAMGGMLKELETRRGVFIPGMDDDDEKPHGMLTPWAIKLTAVLLVLMNVALGAATYLGTRTFYEKGAFTATLVNWGHIADESGTVVIPAEYDGQPVTTIGKLAFENLTMVKKIVVPNTVKVIESGAFRGCVNLEEIVLPDTLESLGAEVFSGCESLTSFTLPAGVTEIRAETFLNCTSLTDVKLHDGLNAIRASAFSGCSSLAQIALPEGLKEIPARAFSRCKQLKNIVIPASVTEIGAYAFESCASLEEVTFLSDMPQGKIGAGAFRWCNSLVTFDVPQGVTKLSAEAFYGCQSLQSVTLPPVLEENKISESLFQDCVSLSAIVIPEGVTRISAHAFQGCTKLSSVTVPRTLQSIGSSAFRDCSSLETIELPRNCDWESNSFKNSPTKRQYFSDKPASTPTPKPSVTAAPAKSDRVTKYTIRGTEVVLESWGATPDGTARVLAAYLGYPVVEIAEGAFSGCTDITKVVLPDSVRIIGANAFYGCSQLTDINMPAKLQEIGANAFAYCSQLEKVAFPDGLKTIGSYAFNGCASLSSVYVPASLESVGDYAFRACVSLTKIALPAECRLGASVFLGSATEVAYFGGEAASAPTSKPGQTATDKPAATATPKPAATATPKPAQSTQKPDFSSRKTEFVLEGGVAVLKSWGAAENGEAVVPASYNGYPVAEIAEGAFGSRTDITKVVLPDTVRKIGKNAFYGCSQLAEINMPAQLQEIGESAFAFCANLESVTLPADVKKIGQRAFYSCRLLQQVTFPAGLKSIGQKAFAECPLLTQVSIPEACSARLAFDRRVTVDRFAPQK